MRFAGLDISLFGQRAAAEVLPNALYDEGNEKLKGHTRSR